MSTSSDGSVSQIHIFRSLQVSDGEVLHVIIQLKIQKVVSISGCLSVLQRMTLLQRVTCPYASSQMSESF